MKILITGGMGFVGTHFLKKLHEDNELWVVDVKKCTTSLSNIKYFQEDCRNFFTSSKEQFDLVIHLAAIVGGRQTIENDPIAVATDLSIDAEMFNWAVRTAQPKVVYFSSSAAYPIKLQTRENQVKLKESHIDLDNIDNPDMTYGWAKLTGEMLSVYAKKQGVKTYCFRPFSGYAEDQDLDYPFPSFMKRIKDKTKVFEIWGDGEQVRDFIHIDDVCAATLEAVQRDIQEPINLGLSRATSFNGLAQLCMKIGQHQVPIKHLLDKPVGVHYRVCDNTKMLEFYKPTVTLEDGIKRALSV